MNEALSVSGNVAEPATLAAFSRDFLSMILMVRRGEQASSVERFAERVDEWFIAFEKQARHARYSVEAVRDAQYALCAFLDESVLKGGADNIRGHLEMHPFQYKYFGVHLAGEGFFERLEALRVDVRGNLDVLEVYHRCLALGFEGKFSLDNRDQLRYIANTLGQDIARYRRAPEDAREQWQLPDQVSQLLRHEIPLWVYLLFMALICLAVYGGLRWWLGSESEVLIQRIGALFSL
ncbi:hypothetical protein KBTX_02328 [wastewater metagenome]|uniref:Type IV / VI secretion system DotU domain-containing protein n=2 Tax=unclassified sequences TaxID=12908 RepID=A0A5B8R9X1_9ZZZZ|nr:type IVB secretion system protein IcmH/DotU [Arhodomonas sp. KWT]QEA05999.1 hypothetical protein KBTEX_02328 [uncultured organism]